MTTNNFYVASPFSIAGTGTFERTGEVNPTATYYDADGVLQTAAVDEPRFTYNPDTLEYEGLLIEPQSKNELLYSEQLNDSAWIKTNVTVGANSTNAPDGTLVADLLTDAETVDVSLIGQSITIAAGGTIACSIYMKKGSSLSSTFNCYRIGDTEPNVYLTWSTTGIATIQSVVNIAEDKVILQPINNGWYRLTMIVEASASGEFLFRFWPAVRNQDSEIGSVYLWGAQIELRDTATSYIKTEASTVTRYADVSTAALISEVPENDYAEWASGTTYALGDRVIYTVSGAHSVYESVLGSNTNHNPSTDDGTYWIYVSKTNRWKMFDNSNTSQTVKADDIKVDISYASRPNCVFFSNVEAQFITVIMYDSNNNVVFEQTTKMYEDTGVASYFSWFTNQVKRRKELFIYPLPPLANCRISAIIDNNGEDAKCGTMLVGSAETIGLTELGASVGIQDYSVKQRNDFGDYQILERAFNKRGQFNIFVDNNVIDRLQNTLSSVRATATLYVGTSKYSSTQIYGFYRDFDIVIAYNNYSLVTIEIEGLT